MSEKLKPLSEHPDYHNAAERLAHFHRELAAAQAEAARIDVERLAAPGQRPADDPLARADALLSGAEPTPALSGGESQRLRLASELGKGQEGGLFVFDEPSIGLHPRDVSTLVRVFRTLVDAGATVIVIEHDLDVIANADWIIDLGPGGGVHGGRIVAEGTVEEIVDDEASVIAPWLRA